MLTIRQATNAADFDAARVLGWDYRALLEASLTPAEWHVIGQVYDLPRYTLAMDRLELDHVPPDGALMLAYDGARPIGCAMARRLTSQDCEWKRIFIQPTAQGQGAGRALCAALLAAARQAGYRRVLLDTARSMTGARQLYAALGFTERGPYSALPPGGTAALCFFEYRLQPQGAV